ncbi:arginine methyl transferase [Crassisporium funariophilum]|nr:arginine methyl transferase [Crassisporium funariophilum]
MDLEGVTTHLGENLINAILDGKSVEVISDLLASGSPIWYQNASEGTSPLHAAAYTQNVELVQLLIEKGAIWNAVDHLKNTAGDIALSFNNEAVYNLIRDAGIRSELLLGLLESRPLTDSSTLLLRSTDDTASNSTSSFLESKLRYNVDKHGQKICVLEVEGQEVGVMMGWEKGIMQETVKKLCQDHERATDLKVLNVGFGLGIIDEFFQSIEPPPTQHVIIEAHPDVLRHMRETGWYNKPGVTVLEGRWQDFIESPDLLNFGGFDVIYTDTFSEDYSDLRRFFEHLPDFLADTDSRFSFFNGLGATNAFFYDIYTHISELHLIGVGLEVDWSDIDVSFDAQEERWGQSREYFSLPIYRLPVGKMKII